MLAVGHQRIDGPANAPSAVEYRCRMCCEGNARPVRTTCYNLPTYRSSLLQGNCRWEFSARQDHPVRVEQSPTDPPVAAMEVGLLPNKSCGGLVEVGDLTGSVSSIDRYRKRFEQALVMKFLLVRQFPARAHSTHHR